METTEDIFRIAYKGLELKVKEHLVGDQQVFRIEFPDKKRALVISQANSGYKVFWTSIPQGRQAEAEEIGQLITTYFNKK